MSSAVRRPSSLWVLLAALEFSDGVQLARGLRLAPSASHPRRASSVHCAADAGDDDTPVDFSLSALRAEIQKRGTGADLGKEAALTHIGPQSNTSPRDVVEHVVRSLRCGEIGQAWNFTCIPVTKRGTHKSSTDWGTRMKWEKCSIINDAPSGGTCDSEAFSTMVRERYKPLLETEAFRLVGDASAWQQKNGAQAMTAPKEYVVELMTTRGEHYLLRMTLVYDWLVYCHLVASVKILTASIAKHFPGVEDIDINI